MTLGAAFWGLLKFPRVSHYEDGIKFCNGCFQHFRMDGPGLALLLRIGVAAGLICLAIDSFLGAPVEAAPIARDVIEIAGGIFLMAGLWTPAVER